MKGKTFFLITVLFFILSFSVFAQPRPSPSILPPPTIKPIKQEGVSDYRELQHFFVIKGANSPQGGYVIKGKVTIDEKPVKGLLLYINGPEPGSTANHVYLATKTDDKGHYVFKVKVPGYYEIKIDPGSAANLGLTQWEPKVRRLLVK